MNQHVSTCIRWRSISFLSLQIEEWNREFTIFQPDSGKTHFLNQMGMLVISSLIQSPASTDEICTFLAKKFQLIPDENFSQNLDKILNRFDALGLIEKVKQESSA